MEPADFIEEHAPALESAIELVLSRDKEPASLSNLAWELIDRWQAADIDKATDYSPGESVFWCSIWTAQHLADEQHLEDQSFDEAFITLLSLLRSRSVLPDGYSGRRPADA